ncbi:MAG: metal ABC transporter ATP-binding protein [bacterium]
MNDQETIIQVQNLNFAYEQNPVLTDLSFQIKKGEYIGLIGQNGSGKTTLLRLILGLEKLQSGSIKIFGQSIQNFKEFSKIGYIPQKVSTIGLDFPASVEEVVASNYHANKNESQNQALDRVFEITQIQDQKEKLLKDLSGGQLQRVFIARSLINKPKILIFDEPTVGVDAQNQLNFYSFLKKANQELGITIIFVTHDIGMISDQSSRILCINDGVIDDQHSHSHSHEEEELVRTHLHQKIEHVH